jgi:hypothetical protein
LRLVSNELQGALLSRLSTHHEERYRFKHLQLLCALQLEHEGAAHYEYTTMHLVKPLWLTHPGSYSLARASK